MQQDNLFSIFTDRMKESGIPYFIGGSVAAIVYGEPRLTHDIDLVLFLRENKINDLTKCFSEGDFYIPPIEVIKNEVLLMEKGHINFIHHKTGFKADMYFVGNDSLQKWALENYSEVEFMGNLLPIAPPEYIIVKKLIYYSEGKSSKHIDDIKGILRESVDTIDVKVLNKFLQKYNLMKTYIENFGKLK